MDNSYGNWNNQQPYHPQVPEEVKNMSVAKLVWSFILFWPLAIPAVIFFSKAKGEAETNPDQAIYFAGRFKRFSKLAITIGLIVWAIAIAYYIFFIYLMASGALRV